MTMHEIIREVKAFDENDWLALSLALAPLVGSALGVAACYFH